MSRHNIHTHGDLLGSFTDVKINMFPYKYNHRHTQCVTYNWFICCKFLVLQSIANKLERKKERQKRKKVKNKSETGRKREGDRMYK